MKRLFSFAAMVLGIITFMSCEKTYLVPLDPEVFLINVNQTDWKMTAKDNNNVYVAYKKIPEITEDVFDNALVKIYRVFDYETSNAYQIELPDVFNREAYVQVDDTRSPDYPGYWWFYDEVVSYELGIGGVNFVFSASDFDYELTGALPDPMQFRIVIVR